MAKIGLLKGSGKQLKVREKSGNFEMDIEWQPCKVGVLISCVPGKALRTLVDTVMLAK